MKRLRQWWKVYFLGAEWALFLIIGFSFVLWVEWLGGATSVDRVLINNRGAIYGALASIYGSLLGFAITAVSIVLGFSQMEILAVVRNSKHYPTLWRIYTSAIRILAVATVAALVGLVGDRDSAPHRWILHLITITSLLAIARLARCIWVLEEVIAILTAPSRTREGREESTSVAIAARSENL